MVIEKKFNLVTGILTTDRNQISPRTWAVHYCIQIAGTLEAHLKNCVKHLFLVVPQLVISDDLRPRTYYKSINILVTAKININHYF